MTKLSADETLDMVEQVPEKEAVGIPTISSLEQFADSEVVVQRQTVVRTILHHLPNLSTDDLTTVAAVIDKLAEDYEPDVRTEVLDKLPQLAKFYKAHGEEWMIESHVVPIALNSLKDFHTHVRKKSAEIFIYLLSDELISKEFVKNLVVPSLLTQAFQGKSDDVKLQAIVMLGNMFNYFGEDAEKLFLEPLLELSKSNCIPTKKAAILLFGTMCPLIGVSKSDKVLIPIIKQLVQNDKIHFTVKSSCVEFLAQVAKYFPLEIKRNKLTPLFVNLIQDSSHRVRNTAYQMLGSFIHSFLDRRKIPINFENGVGWVVKNGQNNDDCVKSEEEDNIIDYCDNENNQISPSNDSQDDSPELPSDNTHKEEEPMEIAKHYIEFEADKQLVKLSSSEECMTFNNFQYWKEPLPEILLDLNKLNKDTPTVITKEFVKLKSDNVNSETSDEPKDMEMAQFYESTEELELVKLKDDNENIDNSDEPKDMEMAQLYGNTEELSILNDDNEKCSELKDMEVAQFSKETGDYIYNLPDLQSDNYNNNMELEETTSFDDLGAEPPSLTDGDHTSAFANYQYIGYKNYNSTPTSSRASTPEQEDLSFLSIQDIVPPELLHFYVRMAETKVQMYNSDGDLPYHCAFNFPAVALTLGKPNWPLLNGLYNKLAGSSVHRVRILVANSLHDVAKIIGYEHSIRDLVPIFSNLLLDENEVCSRIISNLDLLFELFKDPEASLKDVEELKHSDNLKLTDLQSILSNKFTCLLPKIANLLLTEHSGRNWRLRHTLSEHLVKMCYLYHPDSIMYFIIPIMNHLLLDKVCDVRIASLELALSIYENLADYPEYTEILVRCLISNFAQNPEWRFRQLFIYLCEKILSSETLQSKDKTILLPPLLNLHSDSVTCVRIALARLLGNENFRNTLDFSEILEPALLSLQADDSFDVRFFILPSS